MRKSHLHPSMEEPLGRYRQIPTETLCRAVTSALMRELNGTGMYKRIVEMDDAGDLLTVGILIPLKAERHGIRVLYTFMDLFRVELIRWDDEDFVVLDAIDEVVVSWLAQSVWTLNAQKDLQA